MVPMELADRRHRIDARSGMARHHHQCWLPVAHCDRNPSTPPGSTKPFKAKFNASGYPKSLQPPCSPAPPCSRSRTCRTSAQTISVVSKIHQSKIQNHQDSLNCHRKEWVISKFTDSFQYENFLQITLCAAWLIRPGRSDCPESSSS